MAKDKADNLKLDLSDVEEDDGFDVESVKLDLRQAGQDDGARKTAKLDLKDEFGAPASQEEDAPSEEEPEEYRSAHAREFAARIARLEQSRGVLEGVKNAEEIDWGDNEEKKEEKERPVLEKEMSTEKKIKEKRQKRIKNIRHHMDKLEDMVLDLSGGEAPEIPPESKIDLSAIKPEKSKKPAAEKAEAGPVKPGLDREKAEMTRPKEKLKFPPGFLWGTATSAYQVEGGNNNNWSRWEKSTKHKLKISKKGLNVHDFICGDACDSYNRFAEDLKLATRLRNNAIRFGVEWSRVQPKRDTWNVYAIEHYREMMEQAKEAGFKTFLTLWHWTMPTWFANIDAWEKEENIKYFLSYVDMAIKEFGANVDYWLVLNEPMMHVFGGYLKAYHPPQKRSLILAEKVFRNLVTAHKESYRMIHEYFPDAQVGGANIINYFEPADKWNPLERLITRLADYYWNRRFLEKTRRCQDFIGVNYYFHDRIIWYPPFRKNKDIWTNDKGWEIYPEGIYHALRSVEKYEKPVFITENGLADAADKNRAVFIDEHLRYVHQAIQEGIDVQGYLHWSLLDNFEWSYGWAPKFGLYEVNRETFKRTPRPSAKHYAKICKENAVEVEV